MLDAEDIFYMVSNIRDPEHSEYTLADLNVIAMDRISVVDISNETFPSYEIRIELRPTAPRCSLMSIIGLSVLYSIDTQLPHYQALWRVMPTVEKGTHDQWEMLNKQLRDKERVAAALENPNIVAELKRIVPE
eukprot:PhM_4_TR11332/c0_g1_i1/m.103944